MCRVDITRSANIARTWRLIACLPVTRQTYIAIHNLLNHYTKCLDNVRYIYKITITFRLRLPLLYAAAPITAPFRSFTYFIFVRLKLVNDILIQSYKNYLALFRLIHFFHSVNVLIPLIKRLI